MRTFILKTSMALLLVLFLTPAASNAQVAAKGCSAGSGYYSCEFKDEAGSVLPGFLGLNQTTSSGFFSAVVGNRTIDGLCACGLQGSVDGKDLLKKNNEVLCSGQEDLGPIIFPPGGNSTTPKPISRFSNVALAGRISGNPTAPTGQKFRGQLQTFNNLFNSTLGGGGYLFDCVSAAILVP